MSNEIITALKEANHPGSGSGVLKELGDILTLTTARSTQRIYFPLLLFRTMWKHKENTEWSFSGIAVIKFYTDFIIRSKLTFKMRSGSDALKTAEVVFHSMFGTYLENLNVLEQITSKSKWHTRKELNSVFTKRSAQQSIRISPIIFRAVSKMAQALLTKSLGNIDPMAVSRPS